MRKIRLLCFNWTVYNKYRLNRLQRSRLETVQSTFNEILRGLKFSGLTKHSMKKGFLAKRRKKGKFLARRVLVIPKKI